MNRQAGRSGILLANRLRLRLWGLAMAHGQLRHIESETLAAVRSLGHSKRIRDMATGKGPETLYRTLLDWLPARQP